MRRMLFGTLLLISALAARFALAHSAVCSCFDNGDDTITCEGGFSDGSSAAGAYYALTWIGIFVTIAVLVGWVVYENRRLVTYAAQRARGEIPGPPREKAVVESFIRGRER